MYLIESVFDLGKKQELPEWLAHRIHAHTMTFDEEIEYDGITTYHKSTMIMRDTFLQALVDQFTQIDKNFDAAGFIEIATRGTGDRE